MKLKLKGQFKNVVMEKGIQGIVLGQVKKDDKLSIKDSFNVLYPNDSSVLDTFLRLEKEYKKNFSNKEYKSKLFKYINENIENNNIRKLYNILNSNLKSQCRLLKYKVYVLSAIGMDNGDVKLFLSEIEQFLDVITEPKYLAYAVLEKNKDFVYMNEFKTLMGTECPEKIQNELLKIFIQYEKETKGLQAQEKTIKLFNQYTEDIRQNKKASFRALEISDNMATSIYKNIHKVINAK